MYPENMMTAAMYITRILSASNREKKTLGHYKPEKLQSSLILKRPFQKYRQYKSISNTHYNKNTISESKEKP